VNRETNMSCHEREERIVMLACGELEPDAAAELDAHMNACAGCAEAFAEQRLLHEAYLLNAGEEPSVALLAECRAQLIDAVDRASVPGFWVRLWAGFSKGGWTFGTRNWLAAHPALGAAAFVLAGIVIGNVAPRWFAESRNPGTFEASAKPSVVVNARENAPRMDVTAINVIPVDGISQVQVQGHRETPLLLQGPPDNPMVQQSLIDVLAGHEHANDDMRMMALDLLRGNNKDLAVRDSLCLTARRDSNPSVRLKALEALRAFEQDEKVRQTFMQVLLHDGNAGVRIEAINSLKNFAESSNAQVDRQLVDVFRDRMERDPNTGIRVQSAAVVRHLAQRGVY
jgi:HEAT repeat protein